MRLVGIDSKRFVNGKFHALLGVSITVDDFDKFKERYNSIITDLFKELGVEKKRRIYKSYEIKQLFHNTGIDALERFMKEIESNISFLDIFYSYFKDKKSKRYEELNPFIKIYHKEPTKEVVNAIKFIDLIEHSYPYICGWDLVRRNPEMEFNILTDHFETKPSKAWDEFSAIKKIGIVFNGDQCNYLISTADLILGALENRIKISGTYLNRSIHSLLDEYKGKFETSFIGSRFLYALSPSRRWIVNNLRFLKHPIFFIFKEGDTFKKTFCGDVNETTYLRQTLLLDKIFSLACECNGSVKFYDPAKDNGAMQKDDIFIYYGENGLKKIKWLESLGYKNKIKNALQIVSES